MTCLARLTAWWLEHVVGWVLGNDPDRDRAYVVARIDEVTARRF